MQARNLMIAVALLGAGCATPGSDPAGAPPTRATTFQIDRFEATADGAPYFIKGSLGTTSAIRDVLDVDVALAAALPQIGKTFQLPIDQLVATNVLHDALGMTHVLYAQRANGLPVVGGDLVVHIDASGTIRVVNGSVRDASSLGTTPVVAASLAASIARLATEDGNVDAGTPELSYLIASSDWSLHLAWDVPVTGRVGLLYDRVFVDALSGEIVDRHPQVFTARSRTVFDGQGGTVLFSVPTGPQVGSENSPPTDVTAKAAFDNTGATYDCYKDLFQRDSYDGAGGNLKSTVNVVFGGTGGTTPNNAAWTSNQMAYGNGDGTLMGPTARGLDVTAHELTHGVTSRTANLTYQGESGALNEGMSDIMGAVCEAHTLGAVSAKTWMVGEDIFTPNTPNDALRYMADPTADAALYPPALGSSRDFYADRYSGTQDNGGVHLNSGIANLAFELLTVGGTHPHQKTTFTVPGIGIEKSGKIFERALTQGYFTSSTNFAQARTATEHAATDLYPTDASVTAAVSLAWAAVGVGMPPADTSPPVVHITAPTNGATVTAGFTVDVTATDDKAVLRVELAIDGTTVGTSTTAPYTFTTDPALAVGAHTIKATAYDAINNASDSVTVTLPDLNCGSGCPDGETCQAGVCTPDGGSNGETGGNGNQGGGCCSTSRSDTAGGSLLLMVGTALVLRRRRRA